MNRAIFCSIPADRADTGAIKDALSNNLLPRDGEVFLIENAISSDRADLACSDLLNTIDWRQETATLFGRKIPLPRLTAWYGDGAYAYSGIRHEPSPLTPALDILKDVVEQIVSLSFNSVLLNLYRDGQDSMGWHSDDEAILGPDPVIASLSFGGSRRFQLKHRDGGDFISLDLSHGSCLIMQGRCQACWRHQVPKTKKQVASRINLTFRTLCHQTM